VKVMSEAIREQISALLDDEFSGRDVGRTIDSISQQNEYRETWDRYQLIGDAIRGEVTGRASPSIAESVRQSLVDEPAIIATRKPTLLESTWVKAAAGSALAASVALVAITAAPHLFEPGIQAPSPLASNTNTQPYQLAVADQPAIHRVVAISTPPSRQFVNSTYQPNRYVDYSGARWKNLAQPAVESKLNKYLANHSEYAMRAGVPRAVPHANFVGYSESR
jgi:sigma-E factor negative regulatory protein RseA